MYNCDYCEKHLSTKHALQRHQVICSKREVQTQLQIQREQYEREIQKQKDQFQTQQEKYEQLIQTQQERIEKLENQIFEIAKQPKQINHTTNTTTNQRTLNIITQLAPMTITEEEVRETLKRVYTEDVFRGGPDAIAAITEHYILWDAETNRPRLVCTDTARNYFCFHRNGEIVKDLNMSRIHGIIKGPLVDANILEYTRLTRQLNDPEEKDQMSDQCTKNMDFIRHKLPNRLKNNLQIVQNT